jgi:hypothetical protein
MTDQTDVPKNGEVPAEESRVDEIVLPRWTVLFTMKGMACAAGVVMIADMGIGHHILLGIILAGALALPVIYFVRKRR